MNQAIKFLIIEDLPTDAELNEREVRRILPCSEFLCVETRDDFLAALDSFRPDFILSDFKLPQFDGMSALKLAQERVPEIPFIIITGSMNEDTAVECMKAGAWDYVIKEHIKRLGPAVLSCLEKKRNLAERLKAEKEQEKLQAQLIQSQKMESVGRLAGGVAHDFNNMLMVILGHADMILDQMDQSHPFYPDLQEIHSAAERSADLTRNLLAFARKQTIAPKVIDVNETLDGVFNMLRRLIGEDIELIWRPGSDVWPVRMDPSQLNQILANLSVNARDAISSVGQITIETDSETFDAAWCADHPGYISGDFVKIAVSDTGCGMDEQIKTNLFEPFFTTKEVGKGTGLGLATVYGIVKQNNGFIVVRSEPGQGSTFSIYLPRHAAKAVQVRAEEHVEPAVRGHETILLVEDEPAILKLTVKMLERQGYSVLSAVTPGEAIRVATEHAGDIHLLITDVVMPEMNGRDLAKNLLSIFPKIKRLYMSGYTAEIIAHQGVLDEGVHFIQKPFSKNELAAKVRRALEE